MSGMEAGPRWRRLAGVVVEVGLLLLLVIAAMVMAYESVRSTAVAPPAKALLLTGMCVFVWGRYLVSKWRSEHRVLRAFCFCCAVGITAGTILATVVILVSLAA